MKIIQRLVARRTMIKWLSNPAELGRRPNRIVCAGEFDYIDMHYYIFKFKRDRWSNWLVGVCGGFEAGGLETCGHTFSDFKEYNEANAQDECIAMVEMIREYWRKRLEALSK